LLSTNCDPKKKSRKKKEKKVFGRGGWVTFGRGLLAGGRINNNLESFAYKTSIKKTR